MNRVSGSVLLALLMLGGVLVLGSQILKYEVGNAERLDKIYTALENESMPDRKVMRWISGGVEQELILDKNVGESDDDFAIRCKNALDAQLRLFPRDP